MTKLIGSVLASVCVLAAAVPARAGELKLSMANGRVTLVAHDVTVREILAEWARVGQTKIVNGEKMMGGPVTLELQDVPEAEALDTILRSAAGFIMAPRTAESPGVSVYDRIMILATSRAPAVSSPPTNFLNRPQPPQPMALPADDDDDQPQVLQPPVPPGFAPGVGGLPNQGVVGQPGIQQPPVQPGEEAQPALTAPRPGQLPAPAPTQNPNPYQPGPYQAVPQNIPPMPTVPGPPPPRRPGGGGQ